MQALRVTTPAQLALPDSLLLWQIHRQYWLCNTKASVVTFPKFLLPLLIIWVIAQVFWDKKKCFHFAGLPNMLGILIFINFLLWGCCSAHSLERAANVTFDSYQNVWLTYLTVTWKPDTGKRIMCQNFTDLESRLTCGMDHLSFCDLFYFSGSQFILL